MKLPSCFGSTSQTKTLDDEALIDGKRPGCTFCDVSKEKGFDVVYEDDELIAFRDRFPRAREHLLIIPRRHVVGTVPELTAQDVGMLSRMKARASRLAPAATKMGFHIPPFSSVHHLHLHVFTPPFTTLGKLQYPVRPGREGGKKWSWFVTPEQAIAILEAGGRIGLGSTPAFKV